MFKESMEQLENNRLIPSQSSDLKQYLRVKKNRELNIQ